MFLTADQLAELTDAQKPSVQIRWLKERGWPFEVSAKGRPKVLASVAAARMGAGAGTVPPSGPNWGALRDGAA